MAQQRILIFAPFGSWVVHHQLDCVIGKALALRGAEVRVLGCDGVMDRCQLQGATLSPSTCAACQKCSGDWFGRFGLPVTGLSSLLTADERQEIEAWSKALDVTRFNDECFRHWQVGRWMNWVLYSALRTGRIDYSDPEVQARARDFAVHGAMIAVAATKMIAEFQPGHAICYSGTNSYYRVFHEICREAGVPVLLHERGWSGDTFSLLDNVGQQEMQARTMPEWDHWKDVPLTAAQWQKVESLYVDRTLGQNWNFFAAHRYKSEQGNARDRLRIPRDAKVLMLLLSGDWEFGMSARCCDRIVLFQHQLELAAETAKIAGKRGWHLIIRHHPLGAGKKAYPRATAFLTDVIRERTAYGSHVRVIMPGENFSTYDCFPVVDAIATLFTTAAAEALVCGIPVVSACDSSYRHMGMITCYEPADYEGALTKAMSIPTCSDEGAMRLAFRYANFLYFVINSWTFSSVGIKNVYEADFRLASPDDLLPGVDNTLDHVCDNILNRVPLYPMPDQPLASADDEIRLAKDRLDRHAATRAALASLPVPPMPEALVWRVGEPSDRYNTTASAPADWVSRHQAVRFEWMRLDMAGAFEAVRMTLLSKAREGTSPFIVLLPAHATLDESFLARGVDLLEKDANASKHGVFFGCYSLDESGELGREWNTPVHPASSARPPCMEEPLSLMGLVLWRRTGLIEWCSSTLCPGPDADDSLCDELSKTFQDEDRFVQVTEPLVLIRQLESAAGLHSRASTLAEAGRLDEALELALQAQRRFGMTGSLRCRIARWLIKAERHAQAIPLLYASLKTGNDQRENFDLLSSAVPHALAGKRKFKHYWTAVDAVLGHMVSGQEKYLHEKVLSLPPDARIVEIGSCYGRSTVAMAYACAGTPRRMVCIDSFCGNDGHMGPIMWFYHVWRGNLRRWGLESYAEGRIGYSHPQLRAMAPGEMYDFAFIDASHEYADVLLDFELVYPHVKPGGWIAFHDVEPGWPGSWRAWEQTGKRLLADHETCSTIACGRKQAGVEWEAFEQQWRGFRVEYASRLLDNAEHADVGHALIDIAKSTGDDTLRKTLEDRVTGAPEHVRNELFWGATKEKEDDPWLHYCVGLSQRGAAPDVAARHFAEAKALGLQLTPLP